MSSGAAAEPTIWPVYPATAATVTDDQGCVWESQTVRSSWRELFVWNTADQATINNIMPSFMTRWNNLTADERNTIRTSHVHVGSSFPDCPTTTLNPEADCGFYLAHPAVWAWQLQVMFETDDQGVVERDWLTLHEGASYLVRLIDYANHLTTN
ncbi:MAG: hypothetical protein OXQ32_04405 [bacterium]|nr:hypothetical protein [bacterium]